MNFQAESRANASVLVTNWHKAIAPASRQERRFHTDTMRVVTKGLMKWRAFANRTVNQVIIGRVARGENIGFD